MLKRNDLDQIAENASTHYDLNFKSIAFFAKETSTIYKLVDTTGQAYALKIYDETSSNVDDNIIEVMILEAIKSKGTLVAPEVLENKAGEKVTIYQNPLSNSVYRIVLSKWLEGVDFKEEASESLFVKLGGLLAELHLITKAIIIPEHIQSKQWDQVFYFRDEVPIYHNQAYNELIGEEFKPLMDTAIPLLNKELQRLYEIEAPQLLHGDLNPWNVKVNKGKLAILDFEDAIYGPRIQDIAIVLYYYQDHQDFTYALVKRRLLEGYRSISPIGTLKDRDIEVLIMARLVNFLNYVLTLEEDYKAFIQKGLLRLRAYLEGQSDC